MIPKRPTEQSDPHWPEKWEANEHAVAVAAVQMVIELVDAWNYAEGGSLTTLKGEKVLKAIEESGWKP
jgi:hypothetical protein